MGSQAWLKVGTVGVMLFWGSSPISSQDRLPVLDMHLHALSMSDFPLPPPFAICSPIEQFQVRDPQEPWGEFFVLRYLKNEAPCSNPVWSPLTEEEVMRRTIEVMERRNVYGVLSGHSPVRVATWAAAAPGRFIPGLQFSVDISKVTPDSLRLLIETGRVRVFGEIENPYGGIAPDDPRMEPYWALAEELDIPVAIHLHPGAPGQPYAGEGARARLVSALTMEEILVRHPRMRVYLMHAGYPLLDDLLAVLYAHPQVYVDVANIVFFLPRPEFYRYLQRIMDAGFGSRVMFGSDQMLWPEVIEHAIAAIEEAPFLSDAQRRNILYNNAARFLRLSEEDIARHHGR